jgi:hypothetical protein
MWVLLQIIQDGKTIPVVPVMFSVGINELQSYAETVNGKKASALQVRLTGLVGSYLIASSGHHQYGELGTNRELLQFGNSAGQGRVRCGGNSL